MCAAKVLHDPQVFLRTRMDVVTSTLPGSTTPNGENPTIIEGTMHRRWIDRNVRLLQVSHRLGVFLGSWNVL